MQTTLQNINGQNDNPSTVIINKTEYDYKVVLINPENFFFILKPEVIKELVINDNFNDYFANGYLIYDASYDVLERPPGGSNTAAQIPAYSFRGDSRDILKIEITPRSPKSIANNTEQANYKSVFSLFYEFAIYNSEDVISDTPSKKYRKLYFHDVYRQILLERNVPFTTTQNVSSSNINDTNRLMFTGDAMKKLIQQTFPISDGFTVNFADFESGSTQTFFSAPAHYKAEDSLQYLLNLHVSSKDSNYDKAILQIERYPKRWSLLSLKTYFDDAYKASNDSGGQLFLEKFILGGSSDSTSNVATQVVIRRAPSIAIFLSELSTIENFSFITPAGQYTQNLILSNITYNYNPGAKSFSVDTGSNDFVNTQSLYHDNYVKSLKGYQGLPSSNIVSNILRDTNQNVKHTYSTAVDIIQRLGSGRSDTLLQSIWHNNGITFRVKGATYRQSGRFIGIDRDDSLPDSRFDNKVLGIYLVVGVTHTFTNNDYYTDLTCVKTYNFKDLGDTGKYI